jgi:hypothetical protein
MFLTLLLQLVLVVCLQMTGLCAPDLFHANMVAREMVLSAGMGRKMGESQEGGGSCSLYAALALRVAAI